MVVIKISKQHSIALKSSSYAARGSYLLYSVNLPAITVGGREVVKINPGE